MSVGNITLIVASALWLIIVWQGILPLFSLPIARVKRELAMALFGLGSFSLLIEWVTRRDLHPVSIISFASFVVVGGVMVYLLRRLDYYVEELLQELFLLAAMSSTIGMVSSLWYWGVEIGINMLLLRALAVALPILVLGASWHIARQRYSLWAAGIFIILMVIKWMTLPFWGIWSVIMLLLYSTLCGYVAHWMVSTTYAEKIFSWNVAPSKVWSILVLSAGLLVLFF